MAALVFSWGRVPGRPFGGRRKTAEEDCGQYGQLRVRCAKQTARRASASIGMKQAQVGRRQGAFQPRERAARVIVRARPAQARAPS